MAKSKKMMILEAVVSGAVDAVSVIATIALSPYGSSMGKMMQRVNEPSGEHYLPEKEKRNAQYLIYKLKKEGLLDVSEGKIRITKKGKERLSKIKSSYLPDGRYEKISDGELKIIAFDIPEKERRKRRWVRDVLTNMGFRMLQKSVWYGKKGVPERFITDLREMNILEYVDVLAVTKGGSIKKL